jgi:hypothetical protein
MYYRVLGHPDGVAFLNTERDELKRWSLGEGYDPVLTRSGNFIELRHWEIHAETAFYCTAEEAEEHLGDRFYTDVPEEFQKVRFL